MDPSERVRLRQIERELERDDPALAAALSSLGTEGPLLPRWLRPLQGVLALLVVLCFLSPFPELGLVLLVPLAFLLLFPLLALRSGPPDA